jgi:hypothetical protein
MRIELLRRIAPLALALGFLAFAGPAAAQYSSVKGDGPCPAGTKIVEYDDAVANNWAICQKMGGWDIARIGGKGSISGSGYNCTVMRSDARSLGATICKSPPPPPPPAFLPQSGKCTVKGCGVREPEGAGGSWGRHNCSGLVTASLKQHCEERNAKIPAVEAKCAPLRGTKGGNACLQTNDPPVYDSFHFSNVDYLNCESSVSQTCKDQVPNWMLFGSGGQGQVRSCEDTPRSASCVAQMRLYKLCGDYVFTSGYYQEECLIRARK